MSDQRRDQSVSTERASFSSNGKVELD